LYRETKIQETVYEMLTQQYEMAKIQEAKETPTVKVLDEAMVPEKKASPPRLVIIIIGSLFVFSLASARILAGAGWERMDPQDPRRLLGEEVFGRARSRLQPAKERLTNSWPLRRSKSEDQLTDSE
jgi:hypothetical protein